MALIDCPHFSPIAVRLDVSPGLTKSRSFNLIQRSNTQYSGSGLVERLLYCIVALSSYRGFPIFSEIYRAMPIRNLKTVSRK